MHNALKTVLGLGLVATLSIGASAQSCGPNNNGYNGRYNNGQFRNGYTQPYNNTNYNYGTPYNNGYVNYNNGYYNNGYYNNNGYYPQNRYNNNAGYNLAGGLLNAVLNQVIR